MQDATENFAAEAQGFNPWASPAHPRHRGIAMLLVLIAVAIATVLSMSFLASQATTHGVAQNVQNHAQARSVAESALVAAIHYAQTDTDFRTDKTHGQWASGVVFNGGTFDLYGYDGLDTDGDGVVDDTDGDLADDTADPVTLTVVGFFDGVSHTVHAVVTPGSSTSAGTVLYVVDSSGPNALEQTRIDLIESWGFDIVQISENESQSNFDDAITDNEVDVVYLSTLIGSSVGNKLDGTTVGVVTEESSTYDALLIATGSGNYTSTDIDITDNSHYITSPFSTGTLTIMSSSSTLKYLSGTIGAGVSTLAERPGNSNPVLAALDAGDTGHDGSAAPGRRVSLPWSGNSGQWNLNSDGETILQRSLEWAGQTISVSSPIARWALEETSGTTATDSMGLSNGTFRNSPTLGVTGANGLATRFDGSDDFIEVPHDDAMLLDDGSIAFWFNADDTSGHQAIFSKDSSDYDTGGHCHIYLNGSTLTVRFQSTSTSYTLTSSGISSGTWYHVVFTFGSGGMALYVDGAQVDTDPYTGGMGTTSGGAGNYEPLAIGAGTWSSGNLTVSSTNYYYDGLIDDVRIYGSALSASEASQLYTGTTTAEGVPQLIALYEFQEVIPDPPSEVGHWKLDDPIEAYSFTPSGTTYYVRTSGSDSNDGLTPATAWKSISKAAGTMTAGDVVYVGAGTYTGPISPSNDGTSSDPIRFVADTQGTETGDAGNVDIQKSGGYALDIDGDDYIEFYGFRLRDSKSIQWNNSNGGLMEDCEVFGMADEGIWVYGNQLTLNRVHIHDNSAAGLMISGGTIALTNCLIENNSDNGIYLKEGSPSVTVWHTTIARNSSSGIKKDSGSLNLRNSIIAFNNSKGFEGDSSSTSHTYNLYYNNPSGTPGEWSLSTGESVVDPLFTNSTSDFSLQSSSPAIDAGTNATGVADVDIEGGSRPVGGWDIGAYEYGSSAGPSLAIDEEGSNDGSYQNGTGQEPVGFGDGGTAARFDGSDDYIEIPHNDAYLLDSGAVSFWFNPGDTSGHQAMFSKDSTNYDTGGHLHIYLNGSILTARLQSTTASYTVTSSGISAGNWYHAVFSWGSGGLKLILDGVERDTDPYTGGLGTTSGGVGNYEPLVIGAGTWTSGDLVATPITYPFNGVIDDVRIYDQALDQSQADDLYNGNPLDPGVANVVYDTSDYATALNLDVEDTAAVSWVPGGGLTFNSPTRVSSAAAASKLYTALTTTNEISVEVKFTPVNATQSGPARIVSYSGGSSTRNFTFGQDADAFVTRLRTDTTTSNGTPEADSGSALSAGVQEHVIVSYDGQNITMYRNGGSTTTLARTGDLNWDNSFRFMFGNEIDGGRDWLGTLHRVAVYDRAFNATQASNVFGGGEPGDGSASGAGSVNWIEP